MTLESLVRTTSDTFTLTHARELASKVAADMLRCQQNYGWPTNALIEIYATELALMLKAKAVASYEFGYKRDEKRVVSWYYKVDSSGNLTANDAPGKIVTTAEISGATHFNFLTPSSTYNNMSASDRAALDASLPFQRNEGSPPADGNGRWSNDKVYNAAGTTLERWQFIPY